MDRAAKRFLASTVLAAALAAFVSACTTEQKPAARQFGPLPTTAKAPTAAELSLECVARLHNLEGALLAYYLEHGEMPPSLEGLAPLSPAEPLTLQCPASGQKYVYIPVGMVAPGEPRRLLVYEPTAVHGESGGVRWAILMTLPSGNRALALEIKQLPDAALRAFRPIPAAQTPEPAPASP